MSHQLQTALPPRPYHQYEEEAGTLVVGAIVSLAYTVQTRLHLHESLYTTSVAQVAHD